MYYEWEANNFLFENSTLKTSVNGIRQISSLRNSTKYLKNFVEGAKERNQGGIVSSGPSLDGSGSYPLCNEFLPPPLHKRVSALFHPFNMQDRIHLMKNASVS